MNVLFTIARRSLLPCLLLALSAAKVCAHEGHAHVEQAGTAPAASASPPRLEAATELFELVGALAAGEFSLFVDRFETNAPVLDARVEVEAAGRTMQARYRPERGDYVISDAAFVADLSRPGEHAILISLVIGETSDLLNGTLLVAQARGEGGAADSSASDVAADRRLRAVALAAAGASAVVALSVLLRHRRRRRALARAAGGAR